MKKNLLVFPCGSEIGLEIQRSLEFSTHFHLIGASSVPDHGQFAFDDYVGGLPFHDAPDFVPRLAAVIAEHRVDAIFPAMDAVAVTLKTHEDELGCRILGSPLDATETCASKKLTYELLAGVVPVPAWREALDQVDDFPCFVKPKVGYGSRNTFLAVDAQAAHGFLRGKRENDFLFCEHLPGREFTVDCFTDRHGRLRFVGARRRVRISNGISVGTVEDDTHEDAISAYADAISRRLQLRGAWFVQFREDRKGDLKLLEVGCRLAGSSALFRAKGVNLALLTAMDAFDVDLRIEPNDYRVQLDRALTNRYELSVAYSTIYVDYDDCVLIDGKPNPRLVGFLYEAVNRGKRIVLLTRHAGDLHASLARHRLAGLFDDVLHVTDGGKKSDHIDPRDAIFIDDSFGERSDVGATHRIPVFAPDMIEALW